MGGPSIVHSTEEGRLWHQLHTGFGPLGWAFGSAGHLHLHGPMKEAATRIGLRSQCARGQMWQREKAVKRLIQHHPVVVLRMLCHCGWLNENEHLLIRPGVDVRSEEEPASSS